MSAGGFSVRHSRGVMAMDPQIPRKRLASADVKEIHDALVEAYDAAELDRLLNYEWGIRLAREFGMEGGSRAVFGRLVDWTQREGRTLDLLALAWADRPGNDYLIEAKQRLLP